MPAYKLMYFNFGGRAEVARLMFAEAGVKYEDCRIEFSTWPEVKKTLPFGQMPVLYIDDKPLPESGTINRYLARELKLNGADSLDEAYADMLYEVLNGVAGKLPYMEKDAAKKAKDAKDVLENKIAPVFSKIEAKYKKNNHEFLVKKLTYSDLALLNMTHAIELFDKSFMDQFPSLKALAAKVAARPNVKKWLDTRPADPKF